MFTLEALQARHGDCLLLHWGADDAPRLALIDGGPATVYKEVLRDRLLELAAERGDALAIDLMMLSHIDDDHINGLLAFARELEDNSGSITSDDDVSASIKVRRLWHNSLEGLLKDPLTDRNTASVTASVNAGLLIPTDSNDPDAQECLYYSKVLASVPQGQQLHGYATRLAWKMNPGFDDPPLVTRRTPTKKVAMNGVTWSILAPSMESVETLRKAWKEKRKEGILSAYSDKSPYNLSSIVALAEHEGKRILLTGDARGDHVIEGLEAAGLFDDEGRIHVDLLKLPHHGSKNNVKKEFFERVTADHYVVSGDRDKFPNPSRKAMEWLHEARGTDKYKIHCTYEIDDMRDLFGSKLVTPKAGKTSVSVDLES